MGYTSFQKPVLIEFFFVVMINEIAIPSTGPQEGNALHLQDAERNAACIGRFEAGYSMYIGPGTEKTDFLSIQITQRRNGMNWKNKLRMCIVHRYIQSKHAFRCQ